MLEERDGPAPGKGVQGRANLLGRIKNDVESKECYMFWRTRSRVVTASLRGLLYRQSVRGCRAVRKVAALELRLNLRFIGHSGHPRQLTR